MGQRWDWDCFIDAEAVRKAIVWAIAESGCPNNYQFVLKAKELGFRIETSCLTRAMRQEKPPVWTASALVKWADIFRAMGVKVGHGRGRKLMPRHYFLALAVQGYGEVEPVAKDPTDSKQAIRKAISALSVREKTALAAWIVEDVAKTAGGNVA